MQSGYNANMTENGIYPRCNGIDEGGWEKIFRNKWRKQNV